MATTTNYSWTTPDNTAYVKDGASAIRTLGSSVDTTLGTALNAKAYSGLVFIKKQTVGSAVSTVTVTSCFSSAYENYKVVYSNGVGSASGAALYVRGSSGTGSNVLYGGDYVDLTGTRTGLGSLSTTAMLVGLNGSSNVTITFDITAPFTATQTGYVANSFGWGTGVGYSTRNNGTDVQTTSSTGLTLTTSGGTTLTGGTIYVYGYGAS